MKPCSRKKYWCSQNRVLMDDIEYKHTDERYSVTIEFTIFGQPCSKANSRRLVVFGAKTANPRAASIKSAEALQYVKDFIRQVPKHARQMITGKVSVHIMCYYRTEQSDLDEALILDAMQPVYKKEDGPLVRIGDGKYQKGEKIKTLVQDGVYKNDRQVRRKFIYHGIDKNNPRAEIIVTPLEPQQNEFEWSQLWTTPSAVEEVDPF